MATKSFFNNRIIRQPGAYFETKSGISNPPLPLSYGNVVLIDTGIGANGFGLGSGIEGTLKKNKNAIEFFDNLDDLRKYLRGGLYWGVSKYLFYPSKDKSIKGVSGVYYVKAATTTPAEITFNFGDQSGSDSDAILDGGQIKIQVIHEGTGGNGITETIYYGNNLSLNLLKKGFASKMRVGVIDSTKFIMDFYVGTFKGLDSDNEPYTDNPGMGIIEWNTRPELLVSSKEFSTIAELVNWMKTNSIFNSWFKLKSSIILGTGGIDNQDLLAYADYNSAIGGTEIYNETYLKQVLENITDLDYTFILSDRYQDQALTSYVNDDIKLHLEAESVNGLCAFIGGGKDQDHFEGTNSSAAMTLHYDSAHMIVCHSGPKKTNFISNGFKEYDSIYKAAMVLGRIAGKQPQVPGTFKDLDMDGDIHDMSSKERDRALDKGILYTTYDTGDWIIGQAISSLQDNDYMIDERGISYEISIMRINNQLNKELAFNIKKKYLRAEDGANRNTISAIILKNYMISFMLGKIAEPGKDNLIINAFNYKVTLDQDAWKVTYEFVPNTPINKIFGTGFMVQ